MFGFLSLNRIFFSQIENLRHCAPVFIANLSASSGTSLARLLLVLLLGFSTVLTFPSSSISGPLAHTNARLAVVSSDVAPDKLNQFAQAYLQILQLLSDRQAELPEDETTPAATDIQKSIEADTIRIIEGSGLTLPEYMQILEMANQDERFQRKIFDRSPTAQ